MGHSKIRLGKWQIAVTFALPKHEHTRVLDLVAAIDSTRKQRFTMGEYIRWCVKRCMAVDYAKYLPEHSNNTLIRASQECSTVDYSTKVENCDELSTDV